MRCDALCLALGGLSFTVGWCERCPELVNQHEIQAIRFDPMHTRPATPYNAAYCLKCLAWWSASKLTSFFAAKPARAGW
jgi:hypothetical protein